MAAIFFLRKKYFFYCSFKDCVSLYYSICARRITNCRKKRFRIKKNLIYEHKDCCAEIYFFDKENENMKLISNLLNSNEEMY